MVEINFQGQKVQADPVDILTDHETWNEYTLGDGTLLRMKTVVTEVFKLRGRKDAEGKPIYVVKSGNILNSRPSNASQDESGS